MGQKHSADGGGGRHQSSNLFQDFSSSNTAPYFGVKQSDSSSTFNGRSRRRLSVRNISFRRSFHIGRNGGRSKKSNNKQPLQPLPSLITDNNCTNNNNNNQNSKPVSQSINGSTIKSIDLITPSTSNNITNTSMSVNHHSQHKNGNNDDNNKHSNHHLHNNNAARSNNNKNSTRITNLDRPVMDRLRKSFRNSFRKKKDYQPESSKPHQWQSDEQDVRAGNCIFLVKYLGCVEVFESRGMHICEDALRRLRNSRRRPIKGQLYVTGDGLRVVDDETKGLIVDQTIEKVSFCAPDRSHERGFSYICRDGTTRRWMCHGFHATRDSGERLSHAVGCAFSVCLERKQKRDKEAVSAIFEANTFTRTGSFRQSSITERLQDPQVAKPAEPVPIKPVHNPYAVERPRAAPSLLQRQGSLRGGPLNHASPFKRQLSLRIGVDSYPSISSTVETNNNDKKVISPPPADANSLAKTILDSNGFDSNISNKSTRERAHSLDFTLLEDDIKATKPSVLGISAFGGSNQKVTLPPSVSTIQEVSPGVEKSNQLMENDKKPSPTAQQNDPSESLSMITAMCQQLSQGLNMLSARTEDENWAVSRTGTIRPLSTTFSTASTTNTSVMANKRDPVDSLFSFSNLDKWVTPTQNSEPLRLKTVDSVNSKFPLIPPVVVDQMPQMVAPSPPTLQQTSKSPSPNIFSSMPTNNNLVNDSTTSIISRTTNSSQQSFSTIIPSPIASFSSSDSSIHLNGGNCHLTSSSVTTTGYVVPTATTTSNPFLDIIEQKAQTELPRYPLKNTNPFLDVIGSEPSPTETTAATMPMFKAFEVSM